MDKHQTLEKIYDGICIPLVCTYTSKLFQNHSSVTEKYLNDFKEECFSLNSLFKKHKIKTNVDVILMLLPIPDKDELSRELDLRLKKMQKI